MKRCMNPLTVHRNFWNNVAWWIKCWLLLSFGVWWDSWYYIFFKTKNKEQLDELHELHSVSIDLWLLFNLNDGILDCHGWLVVGRVKRLEQMVERVEVVQLANDLLNGVGKSEINMLSIDIMNHCKMNWGAPIEYNWWPTALWLETVFISYICDADLLPIGGNVAVFTWNENIKVK